MGFQTTKGGRGGKVFAHISDGAITVPSSEGEAVGEIEAESRENKNGRIVWELHFPSFTGHLVAAEIKEHAEYGDKLVLKMIDKTASKKDPYREIFIEMQLSSSYAKNFFMRMDNLDLTGPIGIRPYCMDHDTKPGKFRKGLTLYAGEIAKENKIEEAIDRDDVPEMEKKKVKGKMVWDDSEQIEYLREKFEEWRVDAFPEDDSDGADTDDEPDEDQEEDDEPEHPAKTKANAKAAGKAVVSAKSKVQPKAKTKAKPKRKDDDDEDEDEDEDEDDDF